MDRAEKKNYSDRYLEIPYVDWSCGEIREADVEEYGNWIEEQKHGEVLACEMYMCCLHDLYRRATTLLARSTSHAWLEAFSKVLESEADADSSLILALQHQSHRVARLLITSDAKWRHELIITSSTTGIYAGVSGLHLAVMCGHCELVAAMLDVLNLTDREELITRRTTADIFLKIGQMTDTALTLALYMGRLDIYETLIQYGGEMDFVESSSGSTAIHALLEYAQSRPAEAVSILDELLNGETARDWYCRRYGIAVETWISQYRTDLKCHLLKLENHDGYTALTYAALKGNSEMIAYLLQCEGVYKHTVCATGSKGHFLYDLSEIDPVVTSRIRPGKPNVLEHLVYMSESNFPPSLLVEPIHTLIARKWSYTCPSFVLWAVFHFILMAASTFVHFMPHVSFVDIITFVNTTSLDLAAANASIVDSDYIQTRGLSVQRWLELVLILPTLFAYLLVQFSDAVHSAVLLIRGRLCRDQHQHYKVPWRIIHKPDLFDRINFTYCVCAILGHGIDHSLYSLAIQQVLGWYFMLFFTRAFSGTCFFTMMVNHLLFTDVFRFAIVMFFISLGFGTSLMILLGGDHLEEFAPKRVTRTMFEILVGEGDLGFTHDTKYETLTTALTLTYILLGMVLMLNVLIAAMSDTYSHITCNNKDALALKMRAKTVMIIEGRTSSCVRSAIMRRMLVYDKKRQTYMLPVYS